MMAQKKKYSRRYAKKVARENTASWAADMKLAGYGKPKRKAIRKKRKQVKRDQLKWNKIMKGQGSHKKLFSKVYRRR